MRRNQDKSLRRVGQGGMKKTTTEWRARSMFQEQRKQTTILNATENPIKMKSEKCSKN